MNTNTSIMLKDDKDNTQARENNTSSQMVYNSESMHMKWAEQSWQKSGSLC